MKIAENDMITIHDDLAKYHAISPGYESKDNVKSLVVKLDTKLFGKRLYEDPVRK